MRKQNIQAKRSIRCTQSVAKRRGQNKTFEASTASFPRNWTANRSAIFAFGVQSCWIHHGGVLKIDLYNFLKYSQFHMVAHNCHGKTKTLTAKTKYLTAKPKTSRQKQNTSRQNQKPQGKNKIPHDKTKPHGKTKYFTAKTKHLTAKANTHGKTKAILFLLWSIWFCREVFCFCREVFGFAVRYFVFAVRFLVLPWGFWFCRDVFVFVVRFLVLPWQLWATIVSCLPLEILKYCEINQGGGVSKEICGTVRLPIWRHVSHQWLSKWRAKCSSKT